MGKGKDSDSKRGTANNLKSLGKAGRENGSLNPEYSSGSIWPANWEKPGVQCQ
jgi:hypothetical protein